MATYQSERHIPTVKSNDGGIMICACFTATVPGHLTVNEVTMNSNVYQIIKRPGHFFIFPKCVHTIGQWSQVHQQMYNRMAEKEMNTSAAMAQSKSRQD